MAYLPDEDIIKGIRTDDSSVYNKLKVWYTPMLHAFVADYNALPEDGDDLFQDTMMALIMQIRDGDYQLTGKFITLFMAVAANIWSKKLRRRKHELEYMASLPKDETIPDSSGKMDWEIYRTVFAESLERLDNLCKKLVRMYFEGYELKLIAERLKKKYGYIRNRKAYCMGKFVDNIKMHPVYIEHKRRAA